MSAIGELLQTFSGNHSTTNMIPISSVLDDEGFANGSQETIRDHWEEPPTRWADSFAKSFKKRSLPHWMQVAGDRAVWKSCDSC
ncbi:hypothetical protein Q1695_009700 [Nippostrongylus brasiliensis]|nr:hypothetical protein Q1695_009700 [Nippostrongylus brasiliensis]